MTRLPARLQRRIAEIPTPGHPHYRRAGHQLQLVGIAGEIAALVPIEGQRATNDEARRRRALVVAVLGKILTEQPERHWFTLVCEQRPGEPFAPFSGIWAESSDEAIIETVMWNPSFTGRHIARVQPDDDGILLGQLQEIADAHRAAERRRAARQAQQQTELTLFDLGELAEA